MPLQDNNQRGAIQDALKAAILAVTGVNSEGVFTNRPRLLNPDDLFTTFADGSSTIPPQAWFIRRVQTPQQTSETNPGQGIAVGLMIKRVHRFQVEMYYAHVEANVTDVIVGAGSEDQFQALIDYTLMAFDQTRTLGGSWTSNPINLDNVNDEMLWGVMCHKATFSLVAIEIVMGITPG